MRSRFTKMPTSGRFKIKRMTLPIYMLATRPQNTSGCSVSSSGPGCTPWMVRADSKIAVAGIEGMPSASSGIMADTRDDPENKADDRCSPDRRRGIPQILPARYQILELGRDRLDFFRPFQV